MGNIASNFKKETRSLEERGLHDKSYFHIHFNDGSSAKEHDTNWSDMSEERVVKHNGHDRIVFINKHPIKSIEINHNDLQTKVDVPEGHEVFQAINGEAIFFPDGRSITRITGRVVGLIKDGEVVEERILDGDFNEIRGFKK